MVSHQEQAPLQHEQHQANGGLGGVLHDMTAQPRSTILQDFFHHPPGECIHHGPPLVTVMTTHYANSLLKQATSFSADRMQHRSSLS